MKDKPVRKGRKLAMTEAEARKVARKIARMGTQGFEVNWTNAVKIASDYLGRSVSRSTLNKEFDGRKLIVEAFQLAKQASRVESKVNPLRVQGSRKHLQEQIASLSDANDALLEEINRLYAIKYDELHTIALGIKDVERLLATKIS